MRRDFSFHLGRSPRFGKHRRSIVKDRPHQLDQLRLKTRSCCSHSPLLITGRPPGLLSSNIRIASVRYRALADIFACCDAAGKSPDGFERRNARAISRRDGNWLPVGGPSYRNWHRVVSSAPGPQLLAKPVFSFRRTVFPRRWKTHYLGACVRSSLIELRVVLLG